MSQYSFGTGEYPPLNDAVKTHLDGCLICQVNLRRKPVPNVGGNKNVCSDLLAIYQAYADYEGEVNNIVAHDEYGNHA